jgi:diguanylate cyclase (GGDEF)-like protein
LFDYSRKIAEQRSFFLTIFTAVLLLVLVGAVLFLQKNVRLGRKLREIASKDSLTDILNRRYFMELTLMQIERSLRLGANCFVIIFDLDHFKAVNDTYGHIAGDKVLKEVAKRVKTVIRPYDLFGRYGREESRLLISDVDKETVITVAERIRQDICKTPVEYEDQKIAVSASFGISYAAPVNDVDMATQCADKALYRAKEEGRNRVVFYEKSDDSKPL